jgi:lipoprotein-anchoring transpeptidase ErfK/SrfK
MKALEMATRISKTAVLAMTMVGLMTPATAQTRRIVVSIPDHKLALVEGGAVKKIYPVATGRTKTPSPTGSFQIVNRVTNPTYYHQGKKVEPGPQNPVGTRWIGLDEKGYGIHGTNAPGSIGKSASHGCIRMAKKDLEEFFEMVRAGDVVEIRAERDEETAEMFGTQEMLGTRAPAAPSQTKPVVMASNDAAPSGGQ